MHSDIINHCQQESHPGGKNILLPYIGKDATEIFHKEDPHSHSKYAVRMLSKYKVGTTLEQAASCNQDFSWDTFVDLTKPIVMQIVRMSPPALYQVTSPKFFYFNLFRNGSTMFNNHFQLLCLKRISWKNFPDGLGGTFSVCGFLSSSPCCAFPLSTLELPQVYLILDLEFLPGHSPNI